MFFIVAKLFWMLAQPISLSFLLMLAGMLLLARQRRRSGLLTGSAGLLILGVSAFTSVGFLMIAPLEDRFARPIAMPQTVANIVMLGGATVGRVSAARGVSELNDAGDRLVETLRLAELYPQARVVLSGGSGALEGEVEPEAAIAGKFLVAMGIAPDRLVLEDQSRNTVENAQLTAPLLGKASGVTLLVTSAFHMPRAVGLFRRAGLSVVPWPVDYRSSGQEGPGLDLVNPVLNLTTTSVALREWIGLVVYAATGRIDSLLPAPAQ